MLHRSTLDKASRPGLRFQGWKALPVGSKIAIIVLGLIALVAILAPIIARASPRPRLTCSGRTAPVVTSSPVPSTAPGSRWSWA